MHLSHNQIYINLPSGRTTMAAPGVEQHSCLATDGSTAEYHCITDYIVPKATYLTHPILEFLRLCIAIVFHTTYSSTAYRPFTIMDSFSQRSGTQCRSPPSEWPRHLQNTLECPDMLLKSSGSNRPHEIVCYPSPGTRFSPPQSPAHPACQQAMPAEVGQLSACISVQSSGAIPHPPNFQPQQPRYMDGQRLVSRKQSYPPPLPAQNAHAQFPDEQPSTHNRYSAPYPVKQECSPNESSASSKRGKHQRASQVCYFGSNPHLPQIND